MRWWLKWWIHICPTIIPETEYSVKKHFMLDQINISMYAQRFLETVIANESLKSDDEGFTFIPRRQEFGTDNCATYHVCKDVNVFIGEIKSSMNVEVKVIGAVSITVGIGRIQFIIKDDKGYIQQIALDNLIYITDSPNNLIYITRWSKYCEDYCGVFSRAR